MALKDEIMNLLSQSGPKSDADLRDSLGVRHQHVNQVCHRLEKEGAITRHKGHDGAIQNQIRGENAQMAGSPATSTTSSGLICEDDVKRAVQNLLIADGWRVEVAWGRERGIDIEAFKDQRHLIMEAKGEAKNSAQQVNYFIGAIGELAQRMRNPDAVYGIALPDNQQYRRLVGRLPVLARGRVVQVVLFVSRSGADMVVDVDLTDGQDMLS